MRGKHEGERENVIVVVIACDTAGVGNGGGAHV